MRGMLRDMVSLSNLFDRLRFANPPSELKSSTKKNLPRGHKTRAHPTWFFHLQHGSPDGMKRNTGRLIHDPVFRFAAYGLLVDLSYRVASMRPDIFIYEKLRQFTLPVHHLSRETCRVIFIYTVWADFFFSFICFTF